MPLTFSVLLNWFIVDLCTFFLFFPADPGVVYSIAEIVIAYMLFSRSEHDLNELKISVLLTVIGVTKSFILTIRKKIQSILSLCSQILQ